MKGKQIFVINGPGRSGKDSFIRICRLVLQQVNVPVYNFSSIFPVKKQMINDGVWDGVAEKTTHQRKKMAEIKQQMANSDYTPNQYLIDKIKEQEDGVFFVHIREAAQIKDFIRAASHQLNIKPQTIHLSRKDGTVPEFQSGVDLESETREFKNYDFDIINTRHGLEHVVDLVTDFLSKVFAHTNWQDIDLEDIEKIKLHQKFDDHLQAGIT